MSWASLRIPVVGHVLTIDQSLTWWERGTLCGKIRYAGADDKWVFTDRTDPQGLVLFMRNCDEFSLQARITSIGKTGRHAEATSYFSPQD